MENKLYILEVKDLLQHGQQNCTQSEGRCNSTNTKDLSFFIAFPMHTKMKNMDFK